jgi:predicted enzyme related to lactoylglutathione lyase
MRCGVAGDAELGHAPRRHGLRGPALGWQDVPMAVEGIGTAGSTIQLWVSDGTGARVWYERLFGRSPDFRPFDNDTFCEWVFPPGYWEIHVVQQEPPGLQRARLRFGVEDIRQSLSHLGDLGVEVSEVEELPDVVRYCNFDDPWGNRLGLYQDLSRFP